MWTMGSIHAALYTPNLKSFPKIICQQITINKHFSTVYAGNWSSCVGIGQIFIVQNVS